MTKVTVSKGLGTLNLIFMMTASIMSWTINKSVLWCIFHAMVSVIYIPYWLIKYYHIADRILECMDS